MLGSAAAWPLAAHAKQPAMPVIGLLHGARPDAYTPMMAAFRKRLIGAGSFEGQK
jgi:putative ABC transport system substrate-binding protein